MGGCERPLGAAAELFRFSSYRRRTSSMYWWLSLFVIVHAGDALVTTSRVRGHHSQASSLRLCCQPHPPSCLAQVQWGLPWVPRVAGIAASASPALLGTAEPWWPARHRSCSGVAVPRQAARRALWRCLRSALCQLGSCCRVADGVGAVAAAEWMARLRGGGRR